MNGDNKISKEEEQNGKNNIEEQNKKILDGIGIIREHLDQFFDSISRDEL